MDNLKEYATQTEEFIANDESAYFKAMDLFNDADGDAGRLDFDGFVWFAGVIDLATNVFVFNLSEYKIILDGVFMLLQDYQD